MAIKTSVSDIKKIVREEYRRFLQEESELSPEVSQSIHKLAFDIASQLTRLIETQSMEARVPADKLLAAVVDQAKLQMKKK